MKTQFIIKVLVFIIIVNYTTSSLLYCQDKVYKRTFGIGASIQHSELGITLPIFLSEKFILAPAFDLKYVETVGTDFAIGIIPKFYFNSEDLSPFFNIKFGCIFNFPSSDNEIDNDKKLDFITGIGLGAEYFLSPNFSLGVECQANLTVSDENSYRFGNPDGINFNLATGVLANIYFGK